jgi:hypothetical protein
MNLLQKCLPSPNASIGDMVLWAVIIRFPLRVAAGMIKLGHLQKALVKKQNHEDFLRGKVSVVAHE